MMGKDRMENYWLPWLVGMPAETSLAICSLIFGGVLERFPKLKFAFAHCGYVLFTATNALLTQCCSGSFPATVGRVEHGWRCRPDLCATDNEKNPKEYLGRFWVDSLVHDEKMLKYVVELLGEDKVILGTDYPVCVSSHCVDSFTLMFV